MCFLRINSSISLIIEEYIVFSTLFLGEISMRGKTFLVVFILLASLSLLFGNDALLNQGNNEISLIKNTEANTSTQLMV